MSFRPEIESTGKRITGAGLCISCWGISFQEIFTEDKVKPLGLITGLKPWSRKS
jgi:hypothetical protein